MSGFGDAHAVRMKGAAQSTWDWSRSGLRGPYGRHPGQVFGNGLQILISINGHDFYPLHAHDLNAMIPVIKVLR